MHLRENCAGKLGSDPIDSKHEIALYAGHNDHPKLALFYHICSKPIMSATTSIRIDQSLYDQAKVDATIEHRTIAGQIEFWAKVGRAALDNPDLPASFVAEALASMSEPREDATPFVPRSKAQ